MTELFRKMTKFYEMRPTFFLAVERLQLGRRNTRGRSEAPEVLTERQPCRPHRGAMLETCAADDSSDWELPMPNQDLKLAAVHDDITSDDVPSESKQDLKQFGDFSLGEIAVAAVSRPGSNYSKAAEIEFRRREVMVQLEGLETHKTVAEAQKATVEAQKALAEQFYL
jgi:hypothetical protein